MTQVFSSADLALARRIEAGHVNGCKAMATAAEPVAGGWAMFQGVDRPTTQALGVGMNGPVTAGELDRLEAFFHTRGSAAVIDLCTLADPSVLELMQARGYTVREISNVIVRRLDPAEKLEDPPPELAITAVETADTELWARTLLRGFAGSDDIQEGSLAMLHPLPSGMDAFFGLRHGERVSTGAMLIHDGLATLTGGATLAASRGHGLQLAMIRHRVREAAQLGCDLASSSVLPGGVSHRNYERAGFQFVYMRIMFARGTL